MTTFSKYESSQKAQFNRTFLCCEANVIEFAETELSPSGIIECMGVLSTGVYMKMVLAISSFAII